MQQEGQKENSRRNQPPCTLGGNKGRGINSRPRVDRVGLPEQGAREQRLEGVRDSTTGLPREEHRKPREQPVQRPWGRGRLRDKDGDGVRRRRDQAGSLQAAVETAALGFAFTG